ncbi:hypothetical protein [Propionivibrio sp.]|uniref:hypothetical protein n=1 Tax=Propionivibrio sp. TaxID=2212460 RepID=UPI0039E2B983
MQQEITQYASTRLVDGIERIVVVLPLEVVPGFDPEEPPQPNTYGVPANVKVGWEKQVDGTFAPHVPTSDEIIAGLSAQIQKRLDNFAKTRRYDNVGSGPKYDDLTDAEIASLPDVLQAIVTRYRAETRYLKVKTAETWAKGEILTAEVLSGERPVPSSIADIEADLPALAWPV